MTKLLIFLVLTGYFCAASFAEDLSSAKTRSFLFHAGVHTDFYNKVQMDGSGGMRIFDPAPTLGGGMLIPMNSDFFFLPEINWVLPQQPGERILKNLFMMRADLGFDPIEWFRIRLGTSLMLLNQSGGGGSAEIKNGNGTSTFYYPDQSRSSLNNTLDLGFEFLIHSFSLRLQNYIYSPLKEERRQISYSLFLSYYWDKAAR
jgi:hypothetical protein